MTLYERQTPENIENVHIGQRHSFEQLPLSRYYSSVRPLYEPHINAQTDGRISKTIVRNQNTKRKRHRNARKFCSPNFCFEAPPGRILLGRWEPEPSLQVIYNQKRQQRRREALKFASARKFCYFRAREGSPAANIMKFSN